jgi:hypothetical protein
MRADPGPTDGFGNAIFAARGKLYFVIEEDDGIAPANPGRNPHPHAQDSAIRFSSHAAVPLASPGMATLRVSHVTARGSARPMSAR